MSYFHGSLNKIRNYGLLIQFAGPFQNIFMSVRNINNGVDECQGEVSSFRNIRDLINLTAVSSAEAQ